MSQSYQDLDTRLIGLENALMFLMRSMRVKEMVGSPLDPHPLVREMDMFSYYQEQLLKGILEPNRAKDTDAAPDPSDSTSTD